MVVGGGDEEPKQTCVMKEDSVKCTLEGPVEGRECTGRQAERDSQHPLIP